MGKEQQQRKPLLTPFLRFVLYTFSIINFVVLAYFTVTTPVIAAFIAPFVTETVATSIAVAIGGLFGWEFANRIDDHLHYEPGASNFDYDASNESYTGKSSSSSKSHTSKPSPTVSLTFEAIVDAIYKYSGDIEGIITSATYWYDSDDMECVLNATLQKLGGYIPGYHYVVKQSELDEKEHRFVAVTGPASKIPGKGGSQQFTPENRLDKHVVARLTDGYSYKVFLLRKKILVANPQMQQYLALYKQKHNDYINTLAEGQTSKELFTKDNWGKFCTLNYGFSMSAMAHLATQCQGDKTKIYKNMKILLNYGLQNKESVSGSDKTQRPKDENYRNCVTVWGGDQDIFDKFVDQFDDYFKLLNMLSAHTAQNPQQLMMGYFETYSAAVDKDQAIVNAAKPLLSHDPKLGQSIHFTVMRDCVLPTFDNSMCEKLLIKPSEKLAWSYQLTNELCDMGITDSEFFSSWQKKMFAANDDVNDVMDELIPKVFEKQGNKGLVVIPLNLRAHWVRIKLHFENSAAGLKVYGDYIDPYGGTGDQSYLNTILDVAKWRCLQIQLSNCLQAYGVSLVQIELLCMALHKFKKHDMLLVNEPGYGLVKFLQDKCAGNVTAVSDDALRISITHYLQEACINADTIMPLLKEFLTDKLRAPLLDSKPPESHLKLQNDGSACGVITIQGVVDDVTGIKTLVAPIPSGAALLRAQQIIDVRNYYNAITNTMGQAINEFKYFLKDRGFGLKTSGIKQEFQQRPAKKNEGTDAVVVPSSKDSNPAETTSTPAETSTAPSIPKPSVVDPHGGSSNDTQLLSVPVSPAGITS